MDSCERFDQRVVLVTGGTRGIGRGIAQAFLAAGATVLVCARHPPEAPVAAGGREAEFVACDVCEADAIRALVERIVARHGRLDVLVNNAGGSPDMDAATASPRLHEDVLRLNLLAPLHAAQAANAQMQRQAEGGVILMIAGVNALRPSPGAAAYGAAKAGLLRLASTLAIEWAPRVRVVAVSPGITRTRQAALHHGDAASHAATEAAIPAGRMGRPEDIAQACLFLASPRASYVSGVDLLLHGGGERPAFLAAANVKEDVQAGT